MAAVGTSWALALSLLAGWLADQGLERSWPCDPPALRCLQPSQMLKNGFTWSTLSSGP